jgi:tetratricopeptide (TPR) repeat protein
VVEFDAGRWNEARALFVRAHELWPSARSLRTLGMTAYELRNYAQALTELQAALDDPRRALDPDERAQVSVLIEQTRAFVGRYRVRLSPADAALMVDNAPRALGPEGVLVLEVGTHELVARAEGREPMRRRLDVQGREDAEIELTLAPTADAQVAAPATPSVLTPEPSAEPKAEGGSRLWTWIVGGTAVALGATSAGLWLASESKYDKLRDKCDKTPCERGTTDTSSIATLETAHQVTLGLALTAGVGALVLYFVEGDSDEHQAEGVSIGLGTLGVHGRF